MDKKQDELYGKAAQFIIETNNVSTSAIQRHLKIGYNRTARIMEALQNNGIVTEPNPVGKRTITEKGIKSQQTVNKIIDIEVDINPHVCPENKGKITKKAAGIGHNSKDAPHSSVTKAAIKGNSQDVGGVAGQRLTSFMERLERLNEEKAALMEDIKEVYAEAKGVGFDVKTIRKIVALRKMDTEKRRESEELLDLYKTAVGML